MASLKALFSVFSQTASLQFAEAGDEVTILKPCVQLLNCQTKVGKWGICLCPFVRSLCFGVQKYTRRAMC